MKITIDEDNDLSPKDTRSLIFEDVRMIFSFNTYTRIVIIVNFTSSVPYKKVHITQDFIDHIWRSEYDGSSKFYDKTGDYVTYYRVKFSKLPDLIKIKLRLHLPSMNPSITNFYVVEIG